MGNIDSLLREQLVSVQQRSRGNIEKVTVLDIGSGTEATLMKAIIHDPSVAPESRKYLAQHPNLSLELVALSDARSQDTFGKTVNTETIQQNDMRMRFRHVEYSLSAAQTLNNFLQQEGLESINLALGTWSLSYLPPNVFHEVVETIVNKIEPKGRFIGIGYNDNVSGIGFKYHADRDVVHFAIHSSKLPENLWEVLLDEFPENRHAGLLRRKKIDDLKSYFMKLIQLQSIRTDIDYDQLLLSLQNATSAKDLCMIANALRSSMRHVWEHQYTDIFKPQKEEALRHVEQIRPDMLVQIVNPNLFHIQKK